MRVAVETGWKRRQGHPPRGQRGLAAVGGRPLHLRDRRGEGLRLRAGPLHADRPRGPLLVHQAAGVVPRTVQVLQRWRQAVRPERGDARHGRCPGREARPDGQVLAATATRSTAASGRSTSSVAAPSGTPSRPSRCSPSLAVIFDQGAELRHRVHRRHPGTGVDARRARSPRTTPTRCATRSSTRPSRASTARRSPPRAPRRSSSRSARSPTPRATGSARSSRRRFRRPRTCRRPRSAPAGAARSPSSALTGVAVFLVLVVLFIWGYFREWKMSVAAMIALFHDIVLTIGVYALSGFPVTPSAVTGLLAILGFSLYDTVVVFDKVRENTHELRKSRRDVRRGRQPGRQPDPGPLDQHLHRGADPDRRDPLRQRRAAGRELAAGPGAGAVRRHGRGHLLLGAPRAARPGAPEGSRVGDPALGQAGAVAGQGERRPLRHRPGVRRRTCRSRTSPTTSSRTSADEDAPGRPGERASRSPEATGRGRAVPPPRVRCVRAARRVEVQPTRQTRSKRGPK